MDENEDRELSAAELVDRIDLIKRHDEQRQPSADQHHQHQRPTTGDLAQKVGQALSGKSGTMFDMVADPFGAGALLGAGIGAYRSGASFNPLKPYFMQSNPRFIDSRPPVRPQVEMQRAVQAASARPSMPVLDTLTGEASAAGRSAATNVAANQEFSSTWKAAEKGKLMNLGMSEAAAERELVRLAGMTGARTAESIGGKQFSLPIEAAREWNERQAALHAPATPPAVAATSASQGTGALSKALPGLRTSTQWVSGALPTVGKIAGGAAVVGNIVDVGARTIQGDVAGAGISGAGAVAPWLLGPLIGIPSSLGAVVLNYFRDHPEKAEEELERLRARHADFGIPTP